MIPYHIRQPLSSAIESLLSARATFLPISRNLQNCEARDTLAINMALLDRIIEDTAELLADNVTPCDTEG